MDSENSTYVKTDEHDIASQRKHGVFLVDFKTEWSHASDGDDCTMWNRWYSNYDSSVLECQSPFTHKSLHRSSVDGRLEPDSAHAGQMLTMVCRTWKKSWWNERKFSELILCAVEINFEDS